MRFDIEENFFKAVYAAAGFAPVQIGEIATNPYSADRAKDVTTAMVKLMRGAYDVHCRCSGQIDPNSTLLEFRLVEASRYLPDGWRVVVMAENGKVRLDLYDPNDERREFSSHAPRSELSGEVHDAVQTALASREKS